MKHLVLRLYDLFYILYFYEIILIYLIFSMFCSAIYVCPSVAWGAPQQVAGTTIYLATSPPTCNAATCLLYYNGKVTYNFALQKSDNIIWYLSGRQKILNPLAWCKPKKTIYSSTVQKWWMASMMLPLLW